MKITSIEIHPDGFFGGLGPPGPDPDDPGLPELPGGGSDDEPTRFLFLSSFVYIDDTLTPVGVVWRIDPDTYAVLQREEINTPLSDTFTLGDDTLDPAKYLIGELQTYNGKVYGVGKAGISLLSGASPVGSDIWAIFDFDPLNLETRAASGIGSLEGAAIPSALWYLDIELFRIIGGIGYISHVVLDPDTNEPFVFDDGDTPYGAIYGYPLTGGTDILRSNHVGFNGIIQRPFAVDEAGATYTASELGTDFDDPTTVRIYKGTVDDPFASIWFDGTVPGDTIAFLYTGGVIDPDTGHLFCWALLASDAENFPGFTILEIDNSGDFVRKIPVNTTDFVSNAVGIPGPMSLKHDHLFTTMYIKNTDDAIELADGVWNIKISGTLSGNTDPAFRLGEIVPTSDSDGLFGGGLVRGIEYFSEILGSGSGLTDPGPGFYIYE